MEATPTAKATPRIGHAHNAGHAHNEDVPCNGGHAHRKAKRPPHCLATPTSGGHAHNKGAPVIEATPTTKATPSIDAYSGGHALRPI